MLRDDYHAEKTAFVKAFSVNTKPSTDESIEELRRIALSTLAMAKFCGDQDYDGLLETITQDGSPLVEDNAKKLQEELRKVPYAAR